MCILSAWLCSWGAVNAQYLLAIVILLVLLFSNTLVVDRVLKGKWLQRGTLGGCRQSCEGCGRASTQGFGPEGLVSHAKAPRLWEQWEISGEFRARPNLFLIVCCGSCAEDELEAAGRRKLFMNSWLHIHAFYAAFQRAWCCVTKQEGAGVTDNLALDML